VSVHSGHLNECGPAPGGHQFIGQAANLTLECQTHAVEIVTFPLSCQETVMAYW